MLEGRLAQFAGLLVQGDGLDLPDAEQIAAAAIDRWVWYAGWTDKLAQIASVCDDTAAPTCDAHMALKFIRQIAAG